MKNTKLTQKQLERLVRMLKNNSQPTAVQAFLSEGHELSVQEAKLAGIADPCRVIYTLRQEGFRIFTNPRKTKSGGLVMRYRLAR
jgi:uncharacterized protein (DUF169 family)